MAGAWGAAAAGGCAAVEQGMASASAATIGNTRVMPPNVALIGAGLGRLEAREVTLVLVQQAALGFVDATNLAHMLTERRGAAG
jgi:hypothetical protein